MATSSKISFPLRRGLLTLLLVAVAFTGGCFKEEKIVETPPVVSFGYVNCLASAPIVLDQYFLGLSSEADIDQFWSCVENAFVSFGNYVEGTSADKYSPNDLRWFLEKYFIGGEKSFGFKLSDSLLYQGMLVKRLFVGGAIDAVTKDELLETKKVFDRLRRVMKLLSPHIQMLNEVSKNPPNDQQFEQMSLDVKRASLILADLLEKNNFSYDFSDFEILMTEIEKIRSVKVPDSNPWDLNRWLPLVKLFKSTMFNSSGENIAGNEWRSVFRLLAVGLDGTLRTKAFIKSNVLESEQQLYHARRLLELVFSEIDLALLRRSPQRFETLEVEKIVQTLDSYNWLPLGLKYKDVSRLLTVLMDRILSQSLDADEMGLSLREFEYLKSEILKWVSDQTVLVQGDASREKLSVELTQVLATPWPLNLDGRGRLLYDRTATGTNLKTKTQLNWIRALFSLLIRGYKPSERAEMYVTKEEFTLAFADLRPVFVALGLISEDDVDFARKLLRDANLFLPRSNGDKNLNLFELTEYMHMVLAGIETGHILVNEMPECFINEERVATLCYRFQVKKRFKELFTPFPLFNRYFASLNDKKWERFFKSIETATRDEGYSDSPILTDDLSEAVVFMQYIETIFFRFDADSSGTINVTEARTAFPVFKSVIQDLLPDDLAGDDRNALAVFTFMLKEGEPPDPDSTYSLLKFLQWKYSESKWKFEADRGGLLKIIENLLKLQ